MATLVLLLIDTLLCVQMVLWYIKGKRYAPMLETLSEKEYPAKQLYRIGLAAQEKGLFRFSGNRAHTMISDAALVYGPKYAEFYARISWAQGITLSTVILVLILAIACNTSGNILFFAAVGAAMAAALFINSANDLKERLKKRQDACMVEFPDMISKVALLVNSGMMLREAWNKVAYSKEGELYQLMRDTCEMMKNGTSEIDAFYQFGVLSGAPEIRKFASVITQGIEKGNRELAQSLVEQSAELWGAKRQFMLQKGEQAASKLLLPIGLLFVSILIIVIVPIFSNVL